MKNAYFLIDTPQTNMTYAELLDSLCKTHSQFKTTVQEKSLSELFKAILVSLLHDQPITLLDSDFSEAEIKALISDEERHHTTPLLPLANLGSVDELIQKLSQSKQWRLGLFTSGTTGIPKRVSHSLNTLTRGIKQGPKFANNVWGLAYNPTHIAGIQVFLQAVLNGNPLVNLFGKAPADILNLLDTHGITHLSATPTFFRLLLPTEREFPQVQRLTFGGEKFDAGLLPALKKVFPNAKMTNVYASTELGSILAADGDVFSLKDDQKHLIKIEDNLIWVHEDLLAQSETAITQNGWYKTGDRIEVITESPLTFRFMGRDTDLINVGGNKVNPTEVEEALLALPDITAAHVYGKPNSVLGTVLCCDVVSAVPVSEKTIRLFLKDRLQPFKIPRFIQQIPTLSTTRTGKIRRS
ncbi:MAG: fatty acid--CoA ligase family protein [Candidatus Margulisiibacteriota bacterium]